MRPEKKQLVEDIGEIVGSSEHLFVVAYKGLDVADFDELRQGLADTGAECHVIPNRLFRIAAQSGAAKSIVDNVPVTGDNAVIVGGDDPVAVAKMLSRFAEHHEQLTVKAGSLDGGFLAAEQVGELAKLPAQEVLFAQLLGVLQAPARNLASLLQQKTASIVYALKAHLDKQEG